MLRSANELKNYVLLAKDGEIGRCKDFLFDDEFWTVRYMVVDTAKWLPGRKVLVSPISLGTPDWKSGRIPVKLTKQEVKEAPNLDEDAPVSRQFELRYHRHFKWPVYWGGVAAWGALAYAGPEFTEATKEYPEHAEQDEADKHLRSVNEVLHYSIDNGSEDIGDVADFIVEDRSWTARYIVVDTGRWLPGKKVLISPQWIEGIRWKDRKVSLWLTREEVKASPPFDPSAPINRKYEEVLYDFYGRPSYWGDPNAVHAASR